MVAGLLVNSLALMELIARWGRPMWQGTACEEQNVAHKPDPPQSSIQMRQWT